MTEAIKHILGTCGESHINLNYIILFSLFFIGTLKYKLNNNK